MIKVVVTIVDTVGIQDYIFGSNRLRENIGASYLVEQATRGWVYQELDKHFKHNVADPETGEIDRQRKVEDGELTAELIYAGGGNTTILFYCPEEGDPKAAAKKFAWELSTRILCEAPGLEIVIAHSEPFDWKPDAKDLYSEVEKAREFTTRKKRSRQATLTPLFGLGVTAECASTGLVAAQMSRKHQEPEPRLVSREIIAKLDSRDDAKKRLVEIISGIEGYEKFRLSDELDQLGRIGGEESYIAVVHIDGNEMGKLFSECGKSATDNRNYIEKVRQLSKGVDEASRRAIRAMYRSLSAHINPPHQKTKGQWPIKEAVPEKWVAVERRDLSQRKQFDLFQDREKEDRRPCWPVRPIVYGGDDVTFVCNGQLGLSLAEIYMREFTRQTTDEKLCGVSIHTGAGVCIVKVHYPFRRAYKLSEALTGSAKSSLGDDKHNASAIDWHISATGLGGDVGSIRKREYTVKQGSLLMRPVRLDRNSEWRTLENFNRLVARFNYDTDWAGRRNKLKELREVLRGGIEVVELFLRTSGISLPVLDESKSDLHEKGWKDRRCVYFDAIEAMDHHFLLKEAVDGDSGRTTEVEV